jgi:hypothetical protein
MQEGDQQGVRKSVCQMSSRRAFGAANEEEWRVRMMFALTLLLHKGLSTSRSTSAGEQAL